MNVNQIKHKHNNQYLEQRKLDEEERMLREEEERLAAEGLKNKTNEMKHKETSINMTVCFIFFRI